MGHAQSQLGLGERYLAGIGVPKDLTEAAKWYRMSADQGNEVAQFYLGNLYAKGNGVPKDYAEAYKWYLLSRMTSSHPKVQELEAELTPEQRADGQKRATDFTQRKR